MPADLTREWNPIIAGRIEEWIQGHRPDPMGRMPPAREDEVEEQGEAPGINDF